MTEVIALSLPYNGIQITERKVPGSDVSMSNRILAVIAFSFLTASSSVAQEVQQKCTASASECELQIRQMLAGKTYLGVKITQSRWGLVLQSVAPGSPAAAAGLEPGDRIFAVNGKITSKADIAAFKRMIGQVKGSKALNLTIVRAGQVRRVYLRPQHLSKEQVDKVVAAHFRDAHQIDTHAGGSR